MNVALHGFTGSRASWDGVLPAGALAVDLVGHGGPLSDSFDAEIDRVADRIRAASRARFESPRDRQGATVIGYSMGARLALGVACAHPDLIDRLVLIGVHPGLASDAERRSRARSDADWCWLLERHGIDAFVENWEALPLWTSQRTLDPAVTARQREIRRSHDPRGLSHSLRVTGLAATPNLWPQLSKVRARVQLVCGQHDDKFRAIAERAAREFVRASVHVIEGAGHNPVLEAPRAIAELIEDRRN